MLKHTNPTEPSLPQGPANAANATQALFMAPQEKKKGILADLADYSKVAIETPVKPFNVENLQYIADHVDYGILEKLEGTWVSYMSKADEGKFNGSGIHTTIMPSPGTNSGGIPGKYSFDCQEYIEKLVFTKIKGGVRNRGGNNEQFCSAFKYDQTIQAVTKDERGELQYNGIHEENGMYLWLSNVFNHAATAQSIKEDRGIHAISPKNENKGLYPSGYQDETLFRISKDGEEEVYVTQQNLNGKPYYDIIAAKELKPGAGQTGPYFIPDYSISRSGVIPHGSTITLLGDLTQGDDGFLVEDAPAFPHGFAAWEFPHLSISKTMGGAGAKNNPINLDAPRPAWVTETLNDDNDPGENLIYTQRILAHDLYPYSVRPDLRLRDANNGEQINNHVLIQMSSKHATGAQGGILNVPFVNRFVPTVEMNTSMWIEAVEENGREILQLQYEQVIFFEFHFGDDGGTTSWPHIQVNTLRKIDDVSPAQRTFIEDKFDKADTKRAPAPASGCPVHKG